MSFFYLGDQKSFSVYINAKAEGIESKPAFREAFQRCLASLVSWVIPKGLLTRTSLHQPSSERRITSIVPRLSREPRIVGPVGRQGLQLCAKDLACSISPGVKPMHARS